MKWATRAHIHFDRVASAWLILRFVDREASFAFLAEGETAGDDVTLFGVPGARFAPHDGDATTFQRILEAYSLDDAALNALGRIIAAVVEHVMHDASRADATKRDPHVSGMLALAEGVMLLGMTDHECLERSLPVYDALYARLQAQLAIERHAPAASVLQQTMDFAKALRVLRDTRTRFSVDAFAKALSDKA